MNLTSAFMSVAACGVVGAFVGSGLGWSIGTFTPGVYSVWFGAERMSEVAPAEMGMTLGLVQGLGAGLVLGVVVVAIVTWRDIALRRPSTE